MCRVWGKEKVVFDYIVKFTQLRLMRIVLFYILKNNNNPRLTNVLDFDSTPTSTKPHLELGLTWILFFI